MTKSRIGGGTTRPRYTAIFLIGAVIGSFLRLGVWLLPEGLVDVIKRQL